MLDIYILWVWLLHESWNLLKHFLSSFLYFFWCFGPFSGNGLHVRVFTITLRHTTTGRTPLTEGSARCRNLYLKTLNTHNRKTYMPLARFEPPIPASERPQTHALDRAYIRSSKVLDADYNYQLFQKKDPSNLFSTLRRVINYFPQRFLMLGMFIIKSKSFEFKNEY
jgi:hypothetical protein